MKSIIKLNILEFVMAIVFLMFLVFQLITLSNIEGVVQTGITMNAISYILGCAVIILYLIVILYVFPIILAIKLIGFKLRIRIVLPVNKFVNFVNHYQIQIEINQIFRKYQVIRC